MLSELLFKKVTPNQVAELKEISVRTFKEQFEKDNNSDDFQLYIEKAFSVEKLLEELNNPETIFYFVFLNNQLVAYLKLNTGAAQTEINDDESMELERIYVCKEFQRKGIGVQLVNKVISEAKKGDFVALWLGVWEHNLEAIKFYKRLGFKAFSSHSFMLGADQQRDILMKRTLK